MNGFEQAVARYRTLVPPALAEWVRAQRLEDVWAPIVKTTAAWIGSSAPAWASEGQRAIVCMDLGTCFFLLDDSPAHEALDRCDDLESAAKGLDPDPRRPLQLAYADLIARLAASSPDTRHYLALRRQFARAMRVRHSLASEKRQIRSDMYIALREVTIYFEPWLSIWELLGGFVLSDEERALVRPAFVSANRWQVLENERASLARDAATGTPNAISLLASEHAISLSEASRMVAARAERELSTCAAAMAELRATRTEGAVLRYLGTLDDSIAGAKRHYERADPDRYSA